MLDASREAQEPVLECAALNRLAILSVQRLGDVDTARELLGEAARVARRSGDEAAVAETEWNLAQMAIYGWELDAAVAHAGEALTLARELGLDELTARGLYTLGVAHNFSGRWEECASLVRQAAALYGEVRDRDAGSLATQYLRIGTPPSGSLHNRAMEAQCLATLAVAEVNRGDPAAGVRAGREATRIAREINNQWTLALAAANLSQGLTEGGHYGEALRVALEGVRVARNLPDPVATLVSLYSLGNVYQAMLDLEDAQTTYREALEVSDKLPRPWRSLIVARLCANRVLAGDRRAQSRYALESVEIRDAVPARLMWLDFARHHETGALLRAGKENLARTDVKRLGERVGANRRFRLVHLRMLAVLDGYDGQTAEALARLRGAEVLAEDLGLPGELWQIKAEMGELHERRGEPEEARHAFSRASGIVKTLAREIEDEASKGGFLSAPQPRRVLEGSARKP